MNEGQRYLGIDWGKARIGVALAHQETCLALGYATFKNDATLFKRLGVLIETEHIVTVVVGVPTHPIRGELQAAPPEKAFGQKIAAHFSVTVVYHEEMFTTKMADAHLLSHGLKPVARHNDQEAARLILQSWLDRKT